MMALVVVRFEAAVTGRLAIGMIQVIDRTLRDVMEVMRPRSLALSSPFIVKNGSSPAAFSARATACWLSTYSV